MFQKNEDIDVCLLHGSPGHNISSAYVSITWLKNQNDIGSQEEMVNFQRSQKVNTYFNISLVLILKFESCIIGWLERLILGLSDTGLIIRKSY